MKSFARTVLSAVIVSALGAAVASAGELTVRSLRGADAAEQDQAPQEFKETGKKPGLQKNVARTFPKQPPVIPHASANFDEITLEENQCLSCHDEANHKKKKAPVIGKTHFELKNGKSAKVMSKAHYFCSQCHVPQTDAPPLVENTFRSVASKER